MVSMWYLDLHFIYIFLVMLCFFIISKYRSMSNLTIMSFTVMEMCSLTSVSFYTNHYFFMWLLMTIKYKYVLSTLKSFTGLSLLKMWKMSKLILQFHSTQIRFISWSYINDNIYRSKSIFNSDNENCFCYVPLKFQKKLWILIFLNGY